MKRVLAPAVAVAVLIARPTTVAAHGAGQGPPPTDALGILSAWHIDLPLIVALAAVAIAYGIAVRKVDAAHPTNPWPRRRTLAFAGSIAAIGLALLSPLDTLSDDLLSVHMIQHLLLVSVAAPLLAACGIGTLALRASSAATRNRYLLPVLHSRVVRALTFPVVGWVAFVTVMWGTHFSGIYNAALLDDRVHAVEHLMFFAAACLFWWPLVSPDPIRTRLHPGGKLIALLAQMPPMSFLAMTIVSASIPLYSAYLGRTEVFGVDPLTDQRIAGSLMWILGDLAILLPAAYCLVLLVRHDEQEAKRVDARLERERRLVKESTRAS